jgi:hypothetical protein
MVVHDAEVLQYSGVSSFLEQRWWAVGAAKLEGEDLNYMGVSGLRIAGGQGVAIIALCQVGHRHRTPGFAHLVGHAGSAMWKMQQI